jgi:hypothetical protein
LEKGRLMGVQTHNQRDPEKKEEEKVGEKEKKWAANF